MSRVEKETWPPEVLEAAHTSGYGSNPDEGLRSWWDYQQVRKPDDVQQAKKQDASHRGRYTTPMIVLLVLGAILIFEWFNDRASTYAPDPPVSALLILILFEVGVVVALVATFLSRRKSRRKPPPLL